jgi:hypothetical protein
VGGEGGDDAEEVIDDVDLAAMLLTVLILALIVAVLMWRT